MTIKVPEPVHLVVVPFGAWGHSRPLLHLVLNFLQMYPQLRTTMFINPSASAIMDEDINSPSLAYLQREAAPTDSPKTLRVIDRLQLIQCKGANRYGGTEMVMANAAEEAEEFAETLPAFLLGLFEGELPEGALNQWPGIAPRLMIFDCFASFVPSVLTGVISSLNRPMIPSLGFVPSCAASAFHHLASKEHGGFLDLDATLVAEAVAGGMDPMEAWDRYGFAGYGDVKQLPGLPPMYDYEIRGFGLSVSMPSSGYDAWELSYFVRKPATNAEPLLGPLFGATDFPPQIVAQVNSGLQAWQDSSTVGPLLPCAEEFEPDGKSALEKESGKPVHMVGIQLPDTLWSRDGHAKVPKSDQTDDAKKVTTFLDHALKRRGKECVFYVSQGSLFFPTAKPELVAWLLEGLQENNVPFVYSYTSQLGKLDPDWVQWMYAKEGCCIVRTAPQWEVLEHPALGVFVSHCGSNSTAEAILAEIPIVAIPAAADQAEFSKLLTLHGAAIELKQFKAFKHNAGKTFTKLYDGTFVLGTAEAIKAEFAEVIRRLECGERAELKANMGKLRAMMEKSRKEGKSRQTMEAISQYF